MLVLIENGDLYGPEPLGQQSILLAGPTILRVGQIDRAAVLAVDPAAEIVDAGGRYVVPGFVDPHEHLIGAGGEQGFGSRMPEVRAEDLIAAGITTVVGCLGTDTTTHHLTTLLAKARQLDAQGISAYMYTGGFPVPPPTITGRVVDDVVLIDRVLGLGEIAIADRRSTEPTVQELARLVSGALVGGSLAGKAGVTHFHVGDSPRRLQILHALLDEHDIPPECLYPTHVSRSQELMDDAITLARRGAFVDIDCIEEDVVTWIPYYEGHGGPPDRLTVSSDAQTVGGEPGKLQRAFAEVVGTGVPLNRALGYFSGNAARALKLDGKGQLAEGRDADVLVLDPATLDVTHVFARGRKFAEQNRRKGAEDDTPTGAGAVVRKRP